MIFNELIINTNSLGQQMVSGVLLAQAFLLHD
jgi:hypothetical protein